MYVVITVFSYMYTTRGEDEKDLNLLLCSIVLKHAFCLSFYTCRFETLKCFQLERSFIAKLNLKHFYFFHVLFVRSNSFALTFPCFVCEIQ